MMYFAPNWHPPTVGIPDLPMALPAEVAAALGCLGLAMSVLSTGGILWQATRKSRQRPLGNPKKGAPRRHPRGGARRPALYPV
jgi:hypothetical protein